MKRSRGPCFALGTGGRRAEQRGRGQGLSCPRPPSGLTGTAWNQAGAEAASRSGPQPRASRILAGSESSWEGGVGKGVVGPGAERVGRRPRLAAGSQGAGPPSQRTRVRRASVHGQGLGTRELEGRRGGFQGPAAAASPPEISFPGGSCTPAEPPNVLERVPCSRFPAPRCGWRRDPADRALSSFPHSCPRRVGTEQHPPLAPSVPVPACFRSRPRQGRRCKTGAAVLPAGSGRGHRARRVFKLSCFRDGPRCVCVPLF